MARLRVAGPSPVVAILLAIMTAVPTVAITVVGKIGPGWDLVMAMVMLVMIPMAMAMAVPAQTGVAVIPGLGAGQEAVPVASPVVDPGEQLRTKPCPPVQ